MARTLSNVIRIFCLRCRGGRWHDKNMPFQCECGCKSWEAAADDEEF